MIAADLNAAEMGDLLAFTRLYGTCSAVCISTPSAFFFFTLVICFIGKTLSKRHLCSPPKIHKHLAAFSHFRAVDKGQITDGNINFHVFSRDWEGGRRADRPQERCGVRVSWRRRRQRLDHCAATLAAFSQPRVTRW